MMVWLQNHNWLDDDVLVLSTILISSDNQKRFWCEGWRRGWMICFVRLLKYLLTLIWHWTVDWLGIINDDDDLLCPPLSRSAKSSIIELYTDSVVIFMNHAVHLAWGYDELLLLLIWMLNTPNEPPLKKFPEPASFGFWQNLCASWWIIRWTTYSRVPHRLWRRPPPFLLGFIVVVVSIYR